MSILRIINVMNATGECGFFLLINNLICCIVDKYDTKLITSVNMF